MSLSSEELCGVTFVGLANMGAGESGGGERLRSLLAGGFVKCAMLGDGRGLRREVGRTVRRCAAERSVPAM